MIDAKAWHKRDAIALAMSPASKQRRNRLLVRRHGHPHFGNDAANVTRRGDVKRRVSHLNIGRRNALGTDQPNLIPRALFDGNICACEGGTINRGERRGHVKGQVVLFGQHRQAVLGHRPANSAAMVSSFGGMATPTSVMRLRM